MGFFELKDSGLPSVSWKQFNENTVLDDNYLWTVRMALYEGSDFNLPRIVGKSAEEAYQGGKELYSKYKHNGIIVYYPYFIADKSGTMQINNDETIIEAVDKDLWNLVTLNNKDVTIIKSNEDTKVYGNEQFLSEKELDELFTYEKRVKSLFRSYIISGKTLILEWSYAYKTNANSDKIGDKYFVFYEIKEV